MISPKLKLSLLHIITAAMKNLFKILLLLTVMFTVNSNVYSSPLVKVQTDFIIIKDPNTLLRTEISTYKFFCLSSNSKWGVYTEALTYDLNNRLVKKILKEERISSQTRDLPHLVIEKTFFYKRGRKTRMTLSKRISNGYSTIASKEVMYHRDGSKTKVDHTKGQPKITHESRYADYTVRKN